MLNIFGIPGAVAPISSFFELVKSLRGNREDENGYDSRHHNDKR